MVIALIGESCTGKSTVAQELKKQAPVAVIYSGKDYLRLDKNEENAKRAFINLLKENAAADNIIIYVISEKEHIGFLPGHTLKILFTADIEVIKARFAKRTNGVLPPPLAAMLEKHHGIFDNEKHDLLVDTTAENADAIVEKIMKAVGSAIGRSTVE